jgi:ribonuclease BN (tRNA processing enzyme)
VPSRPTFREVPEGPWTIGSMTVSASLVKHPGPAVGYRIEDGGRALAYLPDHEPGLGTDLTAVTDRWISGIGIARNADLLIHDGQYTVDEYDERVGWGHSSTPDAVTFAERAHAGRLVLFHHDPLHSDDDLEAILSEAERLATSITVELGHEGRVFDL